MMLRKTAAKYCDLSEAAFEREVNAGRIVAPVMFGGRPHWHKAALDQDLKRIAGLMADWRTESKLYGT
jgi:hypothetical protein